MSSRDGSDVLGAAADFDIERPEYGDFMFPKLFGRIAQIYIDKFGASPDDLAAVAYKNYAHARLNPLAQMRDSTLTFGDAQQISEKNPSVAEFEQRPCEVCGLARRGRVEEVTETLELVENDEVRFKRVNAGASKFGAQSADQRRGTLRYVVR